MANNQKEIKVSYKLVNQDFNKGITEINSDVKTLNKEFKLQSEQMKNTASDTDKLEASLSNLEKQLELAADKTTQTAKALENAKVSPEEIDLIIVATMTPDYFTPATAAIVQDKLGATKAAAFDLSSACSGQVYALVVAQNFIATGAYKKVLVHILNSAKKE